MCSALGPLLWRDQAARGADIAKVANESGPNRLGPSVPLVMYQLRTG